MSFGLDALFEERLEVFPADVSSVAHSPSSADVVIRAIIKERDDAQALVKQHATAIAQLEHRIYSKVAPDADLPVEIVRRLHRLETECQNLRKETTTLRDNLKAAESEAATLQESISVKAQKVKGALKVSKKAKEVAGKEEEKAKSAASDKKRHLEAERKQRKECSEALRKLEAQIKITEDLRAELEREQSGYPHLRDTEGSRSNFTTLVVPLEFRIKRTDHMRMLSRLRFRPKYFLHEAHKWHQAWMTRLQEDDAEEDEKEEYAMESDVDEDGDEQNDDEQNDDGGDKLYGGMVDGGEIMTGAEHDGWRSVKGIQAVCRTAEARYGS
jgi:chromosome segregation ATPase